MHKTSISKALDAVISLNISHLHDAANYFSLIKNQIEAGEDPEQIRKFSKGAAYHFRSLFEELRAARQLLNENRESTNNLAELQRLYSLEPINLHELLELELLQFSYQKRLSISSKVTNCNLEILGNFGLLSKLLINIVENAVKHSPGKINIELSESNKNEIELKINSLGASLPDNIANDLESSLGHGLSAASAIIKFHNGKIKINSLANEGTSIRLIFKKYNTTIERKSLKNTNHRRKLELLLLIPLISSFLIFTSLKIASSIKTKELAKAQITKTQASKVIAFRKDLIQLKRSFLLQNTNDFEKQKSAILNKTSNKTLAEFALLYMLPLRSKAIEDSYEFKLKTAAQEFNNKRYFKAFIHGLLGLYSYLKFNDQSFNIAREIIQSKGIDFYLASIASNNKTAKPNRQVEKNQNPKAEPASENNFAELNAMIDKETLKLGLEFDL